MNIRRFLVCAGALAALAGAPAHAQDIRVGLATAVTGPVAAIGAHERNLVGYAAERLSSIAGLRIYGPDDPDLRAAVLSFVIAGKDSSAVAFELDQRFDIAVRAGLHCAPRAHRTLGSFPTGTVRMSPGWFTTREEIDRFCDAVEQCR